MTYMKAERVANFVRTTARLASIKGADNDNMSVFAAMSQITEDLFLCGLRGLTPENLKKHGITFVVNVTNDLIDDAVPGVRYTRYAAVDEPTQDLKKYFHQAADAIHDAIRAGGKVVVHCMAGVSRSCSIVLAYLVKYRNMTLREAFKFVRERRSIVHPNYGFFRQLIEFEREIRISCEPSVKMVKLNEGSSEMVPDIYKEECKGFIWLHSVKDKLREDRKGDS
ncbi:dual specificity phosphatase [Tropilaelaps mercedesae]|uniref:Dual specificity phosphatase n=1 Tax=Tropilaelaps mercedesae TaxID=418985 RepID=A0A1V9X523_9ACAR|nr:dual specificity phosphatase [Tropilaelaps mercedesae]